MLLHGDTNLPATAQCDLLPGGAVRFRYGAVPEGAATNSTVGVQNLGPGWSFGGSAAPVFGGLELSLRPVAAAGWADADPDGDGLTNFEEFMVGTAGHLADTDSDGPDDAWEPAHGFDPLVPQLPDPEPDTDDDGVPDRWASWMGERLGDATNYYTLASFCADADGDGFTGWYELSALGSSPSLAAYPGAAPSGFVDVVAVVTSSLPCVLRLTNGAESVEIPWLPGLSPELLRLRLEEGRTYGAQLSRVPLGTAFPANGFWWSDASFVSPGLPTSEPVVSGGVAAYDAGTVRVTGADRGGDWWAAPGVVAIPALRVEARLIVLEGPQTFCHSAAQAEIALASNSLHTGNVIWFSEPDGIEGEGDPLVFDPGEVAPGFYELFAYSEENPLVWGSTHVVVSHLGLAETTIYVGYGDTNLTSIGLSGDTYPQSGISVTSVPEGIASLSFRPSDLEPGTYTVTVGNGSCETREVEVIVLKVESETLATTPSDRARRTVGVGERVALRIVPSGYSATWSVTGGSVSPTEGNSTLFEAPHVATSATVTVLIGSGVSYEIPFFVLSPSGYLVTAIQPIQFGVTNVAGAGMLLDLYVAPTNVSFGRVEIMEVGGVSTNATGYFADNPNIDEKWFVHNKENGADSWIEVEMNNYIAQDLVYINMLPPPWSGGHYSVPVPAGWRVIGGVSTNALPWSDMDFTIVTDGTVTVQKFGHGVTRTPNDEIQNVY
ncbi:MAG: hypothetical protein GX537_05845 [Actinobacteria bacterium]|nr:hypothetical protein [Actinomycetota bacterium]